MADTTIDTRVAYTTIWIPARMMQNVLTYSKTFSVFARKELMERAVKMHQIVV
jgi:hypothetical protein